MKDPMDINPWGIQYMRILNLTYKNHEPIINGRIRNILYILYLIDLLIF